MHDIPYLKNPWFDLICLGFQIKFIDLVNDVGVEQFIQQDHDKKPRSFYFQGAPYTAQCCRNVNLRHLELRFTDGSRILHTLFVKHYNDLLDRQSYERGKDEVTYIYVGDVFCIHLGTTYANFQKKNLCSDFWEKVPNFGYYIKNHFYVIPKVWNFFPKISTKIFS